MYITTAFKCCLFYLFIDKSFSSLRALTNQIERVLEEISAASLFEDFKQKITFHLNNIKQKLTSKLNGVKQQLINELNNIKQKFNSKLNYINQKLPTELKNFVFLLKLHLDKCSACFLLCLKSFLNRVIEEIFIITGVILIAC